MYKQKSRLLVVFLLYFVSGFNHFINQLKKHLVLPIIRIRSWGSTRTEREGYKGFPSGGSMGKLTCVHYGNNLIIGCQVGPLTGQVL